MFKKVYYGQKGARCPSEGKHTCHFKQLGLNDGLPAAASFTVLNTYRLGTLADLGALCGSSFGAYTTIGTLSNSSFTGRGMEKKFPNPLDTPVDEVDFCEVSSPFTTVGSFGGILINLFSYFRIVAIELIWSLVTSTPWFESKFPVWFGWTCISAKTMALAPFRIASCGVVHGALGQKAGEISRVSRIPRELSGTASSHLGEENEAASGWEDRPNYRKGDLHSGLRVCQCVSTCELQISINREVVFSLVLKRLVRRQSP